MAEPVVADGAQSRRQHVAQVAAYELNSGQSEFSASIPVRAVFPSEGHRVWSDPKHADIGDGSARDVSAQIFQRAESGTAGLNVHSPVFAPDLRIHRPLVFLEQTVEVLAEGCLEVRQVQQELRLSDAHEPALLIETGTGHQTVDVGMELQLLSPGVQDGDKTVDGSAQRFVRCQFFAQRTGGSLEEQFIGLLLPHTQEAAAQLGGQSKSDQEIRRIDSLGQFTLDPPMGGLCPALGAGFVVARVVSKLKVPALFTGKGTPAQCRSAAMSDRPDGAMLLRRERRSRFEELRNKTAQRLQHRGGSAHEFWRGLALAGQLAAEPVHQLQCIFGGLVGQMQIHHGGGDLFMAQEFLDGVQMRPGLQEMRGKRMTQRMHRGIREVELFAGHNNQPLEGGTRHRAGGGVHAPGQRRRGVVVPSACVGEDEQRVPVKAPVAAQFLPQGGGQGHDAVLVSFAVANEQFVFLAFDVVNGQPETFAQAQPATVDELEGSAVAPQTDVGQKIMDLLPGKHGWKRVMIFSLDLREQSPVAVSEEINKEQAGSGARLADGLGRPMFFELYEEEVVAQLSLGDRGRVTADVLVNESELAVIRVPGSIGVVAQSQVIGKPGHRGVRMLIVHRADKVSRGGPDGSQGLLRPWIRVGVVIICFVGVW